MHLKGDATLVLNVQHMVSNDSKTSELIVSRQAKVMSSEAHIQP